ncbi:MAG: hypothetical protein Q7S36_00075 [Candidatus Liptonbacteria bacterium]|nr:hypothetical protein [Candidatus Liptonbacteria bacterium]
MKIFLAVLFLPFLILAILFVRRWQSYKVKPATTAKKTTLSWASTATAVLRGIKGSAKLMAILGVAGTLAFVVALTAWSLAGTAKTAGPIFAKAKEALAVKATARRQVAKQARRDIVLSLPVPMSVAATAPKQPPPDFPVCDGVTEVTMSISGKPMASIPIRTECRSGQIYFAESVALKVDNGANSPLEILWVNGDWVYFDGTKWSSNFQLPDAGRYASGAPVQSGIRHVGDLFRSGPQHSSFRLRGPGVAKITIEPIN